MSFYDIKYNRKPIITILNNKDYLVELNKKIQEEVQEYLESNNIEELSDMVEVRYEILRRNKKWHLHFWGYQLFFRLWQLSYQPL